MVLLTLKIKRTKEELKSIPNKTRSRLDVDTGLLYQQFMRLKNR